MSSRWPNTYDGVRQPLGAKLSWLCSAYTSRKQFRAVLSCLAKHSSPRCCQGQGRQAIVESRPPAASD
eukprot:6279480-Alexandrium_andersonii.AAC.1